MTTAGMSVGGIPIYHVRYGTGSTRALVVAGPQAQEPIGGLTVFSLMSLLQQSNAALVAADVEWHIIPCIDPDAALLNEGWYVQPFTFDNYMKNFYMQPRPEQVDFSFPLEHKKLRFDRPSREANILKNVLDEVEPDFFFTLHNYGILGGTWFSVSHDIGQKYYDQIYRLLDRNRITLQRTVPNWLRTFARGIRDGSQITVRQYYDYLEETTGQIPSTILDGKVGASSYEYLLDIKPSALVFVAELTYGQHPADDSDEETGENLRRVKLRLDAENKFLATVILEEWEKVVREVDPKSPFYRKIKAELIDARETLHEGVTAWYATSTQDVLFNPAYSKVATEAERVLAYVWDRSSFLCNAYSFLRLLRASDQTPAVAQAIARLEPLFDEAVQEMKDHLDFTRFETIDCDRLARVQLGSGLIALNSVLEQASA